MRKVQNINRYWVDKDSNIIVRKWDEKEYEMFNPRIHIFEKYWSYHCPICSFLPTPHHDKAEAEYNAKAHERYTGNKHKCIVEYRDHELRCMEFRDEFVEDLGVWIAKQELF